MIAKRKSSMQRIYTPMTGLLLTLCSTVAGCGAEEANAETGTVEASLDGGGNFSHTCSDIHLEPSSIWLHASCKNVSGSPTDTRIDLNNHLGNNNGGLTW